MVRFKRAYRIAVPYPLGGAVRLSNNVVVKLEANLRGPQAFIEGAV